MRVRASGDPVLEAFDSWTLSIGNGDKRDGLVPIPDDMLVEIVPNTPKEQWHEAESRKEFCREIFPQLDKTLTLQAGWMVEQSWPQQTRKLTL